MFYAYSLVWFWRGPYAKFLKPKSKAGEPGASTMPNGHLGLVAGSTLRSKGSTSKSECASSPNCVHFVRFPPGTPTAPPAA